GIAFAWEPGKAVYVNLARKDLFFPGTREPILNFLANSKAVKIGHNLKFDCGVLRWHDCTVTGPFCDTMLAHYLLAPNARHTLDAIAAHELNYHTISYHDLTEKGKYNLLELPVEDVGRYCCEDTDIALQLADKLIPEIEQEDLKQAFELECQLIPILVGMEYLGIAIDKAKLEAFSRQLEQAIIETREAIFSQCGVTFNLDSPKQLGEVLFEHLKLVDKPKRTPSGQYATNERILTQLAPKFPIIQDILIYRQLTKLQNTYALKLPKMVSSRTNRIHASFNQISTITGRISCDNPNLQNIPIRTPLGEEIRKVFIPGIENGKLLSADYSQIELRIMAHFSNSQPLLEAFAHGEDIHRSTAAHVFGVKAEDVTDEMRSRAKMVNYGLAYGMSAYGLAQRLNISNAEAKEIMDRYFSAFPEIRSFMDRTIEEARQHGYVKTLLGRRRYLENINSKNRNVREAEER
ncbi:MAG: DNA polymerase I, partial [Lentisphaerae bacterium]